MELVSTMEISGEEREISDAYAREQIATNTQNIATNAEGIAGLNNNLSQLEFGENIGGKNLFKPELQTTTSNGVTCTNNGDGTYTLNGTSTSAGSFIFGSSKLPAGKYKFIGMINGSTTGTTNAYINFSGIVNVTNVQGVIYTIDSEKTTNVGLMFSGGYPFNNLIVKPMITTDTTLTYDDYEPYIPSVKMLAEEVSAQNESLDELKVSDYAGGKNKFNKNTITKTSYLDSDGSIIGNKEGYCVSDFIPVTSGKTYHFPKRETVRTKFYNSSKVATTSSWDVADGDVNVTIPSGVAYIRCSINLTIIDLNTFQIEEGIQATEYEPYIPSVKMLSADVSELKNDLSDCRKKSDITTNETLIGTFNGKNYYRRLFTGIGASGSSVTVNVGEKIEIYNYYGRAYTYGQSGASDVKYPIPNKNYYIDSQNASETSFQLTIPTSSDTRKVDLVIEYTKVDE